VSTKTVAESKLELSQVMLPGDANPDGFVHGGTIMKLVDTAAGVVAMRHARRRVATVSVDSMSFLAPARVGDLVVIRASVNDAGRTSLEVGVRVDVEEPLTGRVTHTSSAYLVMVALDERGKPARVPQLVAETVEERRRMIEARARRARRAALREPAAINGLAIGEPISVSPAVAARAAALPAPAPWRAAKPGRPLVVGHRGASGHAPENTLVAFERALGDGADALECDIHLTQDGRLAVIHDGMLDRTTNGHGLVAGFTLATLKTLDAGGGERIPALEEVLELAKGRARVIVEIKSGPLPYAGIESALVKAIGRVCGRAGDKPEVLAISFDHRVIRNLRELAPGLATGLLYLARAADPAALARSADAQVLMPQHNYVSADDVRAAHDAGLGIFAWTADDPADIARLARIGIDGITSNYPDRVRSLVGPGT
jgi:glycerophosphoryl diester phosphodiesterase